MGIRIELRRSDGGLLRLAEHTTFKRGLILAGENDPPPRRASVALNPRFGWDRLPSRPEIAVRIEDGSMVVDSEPPGRLPIGRYRIGVEVDDVVVTPPKKPEVEVDGQGRGKDVVAFAAEPRRLPTLRPFDQFDGRIRAVCEANSIDGLRVPVWLEDEKPQARRKACLLNLLAALRARGDNGDFAPAGSLGPSLVAKIRTLHQVHVDHLVTTVDPSLFDALEKIVGPSKKRRRVVDADDLIHNSHKDALTDAAGALHLSGLTRFKGYRWRGRPSMQVVLLVPEEGGAAEVHLADVDLDRANPREGFFQLVVHIGELFDDGIDHTKLRDKLADRAEGAFLPFAADAGGARPV